MNYTNIGKNIKNDYGLLLDQFQTELDFELVGNIKFGSRIIGWKFRIPDYYAIARENERKRKAELGIIPRPDYIQDLFEPPPFNKESKEQIKWNILRILMAGKKLQSCKWSNVYVRHLKNGEFIKRAFTEGEFDKGKRIPHIFYGEVYVGDTIEICYCSKFIWFWWWFKPKWFKITGTIVGLTSLLFTLINYKSIFKLISWFFKLLNKS